MKKILIAALFCVHVYGDATVESCDLKNIKEFNKKVLAGNPVAQRAYLEIGAANALIDEAKQRPNPQAMFEAVENNGVEESGARVKLMHTIELGGKRQARIKRSRAQAALLGTQADLDREKSEIDSLLVYQRAAQLEVLIGAMKEARGTFSKVIKKLSSAKRLNPEEKVSLSTLRLAYNDYAARLNDLKNEEELLAGQASFMSSCSLKSFSYSEPNFKELKNKALSLNLKKGPGALAAKDIELAQGEVDVANSLGNTNLKIGPILGYDWRNGNQAFAAGIGITFDAQVFHRNQGGRELAAKNLLSKKKRSRNQITSLKIRLENQERIYQHSLGFYNSMPNLKSIHAYHQEVEGLFERGVVGIPMIIEAHRQYVDYIESRFETENDIFLALKEMVLLSGDKNLFTGLF